MTIARPRTSGPRHRPPAPRRGRLGVQGGRAAFIATGPTAWYDARDLLSTSQQTLTNRVGTGTATLGSTGTSDTNDPVALIGSGYVYLPGSGAGLNYLSVPDAAALDIIGDIDIRAEASTTWTGSAAHQYITTKWNTTGNQRSYALRIDSTGRLSLLWSVDGIATTTATSTVSTPMADGARAWIRATLDVDNGASGYDVKFYTSTDGTTWTQLGATVVGGATTSVFASTASAAVGVLQAGTNPFAGNFYRAIIKNGIDGTTVLDINPTTETLGQASWTCTTGQTVTVNRSTTGLTTSVVTRPLLMADGTDDYVQLPAGDTPTFTATTGAGTALLIMRNSVAAPVSNARLWSSESASGDGTILRTVAGTGNINALTGGSVTSVATANVATPVGTLSGVALVQSNGTLAAWSDTSGMSATVDTTGVGTVTHTAPRLGVRGHAVLAPSQSEIFAVVHWARALTATELAAAANYLLGTYA